MTRPPAPLAIRSIDLVDVRTFARLQLELAPGLTVLVGPNGVGKTNLLEACAAVLSGTSPRTSAELRLVRDGASAARIAARIELDGAEHERELRFELGRGKALRLDGSPARGVEAFARRTPSLVFLPERLLVIRGAPARRRALIDGLMTRLEPTSAVPLAAYGKALQQRNALLRRAKVGRDVGDQLVPWSDQLAAHAADIRAARRRLLDRLQGPFAARLQELTDLPDGSFELQERGPDDLRAALDEQLPIDTRRGSTTIGPHLDDLLPCQGGRDLRAFGSTGEQRASLLAFTFAAADLVRTEQGIEPILLLDEPWSELDADRRRRLSDLLLQSHQVICTTTEPPGHLLERRSAGAAVDVRRVSFGAVTPWDDAATDSSTSRS